MSRPHAAFFFGIAVLFGLIALAIGSVELLITPSPGVYESPGWHLGRFLYWFVPFGVSVVALAAAAICRRRKLTEGALDAEARGEAGFWLVIACALTLAAVLVFLYGSLVHFGASGHDRHASVVANRALMIVVGIMILSSGAFIASYRHYSKASLGGKRTPGRLEHRF